jgi:hypothetical protein
MGRSAADTMAPPADKEFRDDVDSDHLDDTYTHDSTGRKMVGGHMDRFFHKVGYHFAAGSTRSQNPCRVPRYF